MIESIVSCLRCLEPAFSNRLRSCVIVIGIFPRRKQLSFNTRGRIVGTPAWIFIGICWVIDVLTKTVCAWLITFKRHSTCSTCLARDLIEAGRENLAGYTINHDLDVSSCVTFKAPTLYGQSLTTSRKARCCAYRFDLWVSLDKPAVTLVSKLAVLCRFFKVCIADPEAHFRHTFSRVLVTSSCRQRIYFVVI